MLLLLGIREIDGDGSADDAADGSADGSADDATVGATDVAADGATVSLCTLHCSSV